MTTLTLKEAATYLKMHHVTLLRKAQAGSVPAAKPAKCWVFIMQDLQDYLRSLYRYRNDNNDEVTETEISAPLSTAKQSKNKGLGSKHAYYQLLGIDDCPQTHSPQPASRSGACHADEVKRVAKGEAVRLVDKSANVTQSKARVMQSA